MLDRGVPAADIVVTAAVKPRALLELCVAARRDRGDRQRGRAAAAARGGRRAGIPCRSRCASRPRPRRAAAHALRPRAAEMLALLDRCWPAGGVTPLTIAGVHFHLDGYAAAHRVAALTEGIAARGGTA